MNKLMNGTQYRAIVNGYVLVRGKREIYIIAKSVEQGDKAKNLIANVSFDKMFKKGKRINAFGNLVRAIYL